VDEEFRRSLAAWSPPRRPQWDDEEDRLHDELLRKLAANEITLDGAADRLREFLREHFRDMSVSETRIRKIAARTAENLMTQAQDMT
jgi:hypothetical protein